mmetsp:Transcript_21513/g.36891  ORF Transcript_21513/g.36891 Transcript_21513/m.36891 type:complete len:201 (-) Transcript_21513:1009-1611(-)
MKTSCTGDMEMPAQGMSVGGRAGSSVRAISPVQLGTVSTRYHIDWVPYRLGGWLVVVAAGDDLLAGGAEIDGVLELGDVAALDVAQRRVRLDDAGVHEVLQRHQVLGLPKPVQVATTEGEGVEVLVDGVQQLLRPRQAQGDVADVVVLHVVGALALLDDVRAAGGAERLDGEELALLHLHLLAPLHDRHRLARVDPVRRD